MSEPRIASTEVFDGSATWVSRWIELSSPASIISFLITWTAVAATVGVLTVEVTNDPAQASTSVVTLTTASLTLWGTGFVPDASAGKTWLSLEALPRFVRVKYTRSAGGGAAQFSLFTFGGN